MAKPKIALVPAAQGSKFYSVLPSSGVGDFDFTRSGSATRINSQGLIETVGNGVSRLNYPLIDGKVVGCPSHLLENSATNLITYSENFSNAYWTKEGTSITPNTVISPDGTLNADKLVESATTAQHRIYSATVTTSAALYTSSVFAKAGERGWISIEAVQGGGRVWFDLTNGVVGSNTASSIGTIKQYPNGWYKCSNTWTDTGGGGNRSFINVCSGDSIISYTGDGTSGVYIYGAQVEQGSFPTSYIPTSGSQATRSAETANGSGDASTFNDSEGVLMTEISALANDSTSRQISLSSGSSATNKVSLNYTATSNQVQAFIRSGGSIAFNVSEIVSDTTNNNKIALKYKQNDFALWVNGIELATNTIDGNTPTGLNVLDFDDADGTSNFYGNTKQLQYYDSALTDSELETLTSWVSFSDMANGQLYTIE